MHAVQDVTIALLAEALGPLGARDTRRPDSEFARSDQRSDVAIVRPASFWSCRIASSALLTLR